MAALFQAWSCRFLGALVLLTGLLAAVAPANAAEMFMYRKKGCPWCEAWDREIGPAYGKTPVGQKAPIRMVDLAEKPQPDVALAKRVVYTPTFVLVENNKEVGRLEGYPGQEFFWSLIEELVERLPPAPTP